MHKSLFSNTKNKQSIVKFFIAFILSIGLLFLLMTFFLLVPKLDRTFSDLNDEANLVSANVLLSKLRDYIHNRQLVLQEIGGSALIVNATLLGDHDNSALKDLIAHASILGEDPEITIIDAVGDIFYSEYGGDKNLRKRYQWAVPLLEKSRGHTLLNIPIGTTRFEIAIPIIYGKRAEGVIVANIDARPEVVFKKEFLSNTRFAVAYKKDVHTIESRRTHIDKPRREIITLDEYGLNFTYISDYSSVLEKEDDIIVQFVLSAIVGVLIIQVLLFILGRKIILVPYQALAASQKAIESAVEGISFVDVNEVYVSINKAYEKLVGYTESELKGRHWQCTVEVDERGKLRQAYETMRKKGKASVEIRGLRKDQSTFYQQLTFIEQLNEQDRYVGFYCFAQDITLVKLSEDKIRQQQQELQLIFDHVPIRIIYKDDQNNILRLNQQAALSMGGLTEDFEGKNAYELFPEMAKKYHDDDLEVIISKKPKLNIVERYTPQGQSSSWVSTDKIPYVDPKNNKSFVFVCIQDITPLKESEMAQKKLVEELSFTNNELAQFAYIASHDLKSPLRGIEQLADWVVEDCAGLLPEESEKHLLLIVSRVRRMSKLLDDLLAYSRVSQLESLEENLNLKYLLEQMLDLHVQSFGFRCTLDVPDECIVIARQPLEIILRNLLDNSVKHHHKGSGHITVHYTESNNSHIIRITDDGPGISPKMHEQAFEMFQTLQPRDEVEGSGIGLAIIKKILHRFKGHVGIISDGHSGTTFEIIWPKK